MATCKRCGSRAARIGNGGGMLACVSVRCSEPPFMDPDGRTGEERWDEESLRLAWSWDVEPPDPDRVTGT